MQTEKKKKLAADINDIYNITYVFSNEYEMILILQKAFIPEMKQLEEKKWGSNLQFYRNRKCYLWPILQFEKEYLNNNEKLTQLERILIIFQLGCSFILLLFLFVRHGIKINYVSNMFNTYLSTLTLVKCVPNYSVNIYMIMPQFSLPAYGKASVSAYENLWYSGLSQA